MARADLLVKLVQAASQGDTELLQRAVAELGAEERAKNHHVLADRLDEAVRLARGTRNGAALRVDAPDVSPLLYETMPRRSLDDLVLPERLAAALTDLAEEQHRRDLLQSHGIEPRHRVLLAGPPGNGKTALAEALAHLLVLPLFVVRYEGLIGSFLGETSGRIQRLFEHIRSRQCVLFFDEFDTVAKERGDVHETGEVKRIVSTLLLQIDRLPSHVVVVTATNHPELLDRAVWRRFQLKLAVPEPDTETRAEFLRRWEHQQLHEPLGMPLHRLSCELEGASFSDLEEFCLDVRRHAILNPQQAVRSIVKQRVEAWRSRYQLPRD